jgi:hypothetical protein
MPGFGALVVAGVWLALVPPAWADCHFGAVHLRPMIVSDYLVVTSTPPRAAQPGGMLLTLPLGGEGNLVQCDFPRARLKFLALGLYGPGLNWIGLTHSRPWYPVVLGAGKVDAIEFSVLVPDMDGSWKHTGELGVGIGIGGVATAEAFNEDAESGNGLSAGVFLGFSFTPAGL